MADEDQVLSSLLEYVKAEQRICPMPFRWTELWEMLPGKRSGSVWAPPPPLILAAWWDTPSFAKMERLAEHISYAHAHGVLGEVSGVASEAPLPTRQERLGRKRPGRSGGDGRCR